MPAPARSLSLLGPVEWADAALKLHGERSDSNAASGVLRELVMWWLLVCLWRYSATKIRVCGGRGCFSSRRGWSRLW